MRLNFIKMARSVIVVLTFAAFTSTASFAACNPSIARTRPDTRYEAVAGTNGAEVRDKVTRLIWQRCAIRIGTPEKVMEGAASWNGTSCSSTSVVKTWIQALEIARNAIPSPVAGASAWRLPNQAELYSLAERACWLPAINETWFPNDAQVSVWSSSNYSNINGDFPARAWGVSFGDGTNNGTLKNETIGIRLVRSGP